MGFTGEEKRLVDQYNADIGKNPPGIDLLVAVERVIAEEIAVEAPGAWQTITDFQNGWGAASGLTAPAYRLSGNGSLEFRGALRHATGSAGPVVLFVLPTGFRPAGFPVLAATHRRSLPALEWAGTAISLDSTNGEVTYLGVFNAVGMNVYLDGVRTSLGA